MFTFCSFATAVKCDPRWTALRDAPPIVVGASVPETVALAMLPSFMPAMLAWTSSTRWLSPLLSCLLPWTAPSQKAIEQAPSSSGAMASVASGASAASVASNTSSTSVKTNPVYQQPAAGLAAVAAQSAWPSHKPLASISSLPMGGSGAWTLKAHHEDENDGSFSADVDALLDAHVVTSQIKSSPFAWPS